MNLLHSFAASALLTSVVLATPPDANASEIENMKFIGTQDNYHFIPTRAAEPVTSGSFLVRVEKVATFQDPRNENTASLNCQDIAWHEIQIVRQDHPRRLRDFEKELSRANKALACVPGLTI